MKRLTILFLLMSLFTKAQLLDSMKVDYSKLSKEVTIELHGQFMNMDPTSIKLIKDSIYGDTTLVQVYMKPCSPYQLWLYFDTTFTVSGAFYQGINHIKVLSYLMKSQDSCCQLANHLVADTLYGFFYAPTVGLNEISRNATIVYPNPTKDKLEIQYEGENDFSLLLYNFQGKLLLSRKNEKEIHLEGLPEGIYLLVIEDGLNRSLFRVIKTE